MQNEIIEDSNLLAVLQKVESDLNCCGSAGLGLEVKEERVN